MKFPWAVSNDLINVEAKRIQKSIDRIVGIGKKHPDKTLYVMNRLAEIGGKYASGGIETLALHAPYSAYHALTLLKKMEQPNSLYAVAVIGTQVSDRFQQSMAILADIGNQAALEQIGRAAAKCPDRFNDLVDILATNGSPYALREIELMCVSAEDSKKAYALDALLKIDTPESLSMIATIFEPVEAADIYLDLAEKFNSTNQQQPLPQPLQDGLNDCLIILTEEPETLVEESVPGKTEALRVVLLRATHVTNLAEDIRNTAQAALNIVNGGLVLSERRQEYILARVREMEKVLS